jgi:glutamate/tyrosine decarboxylase-like PLP-dependent enzyme
MLQDVLGILLLVSACRLMYIIYHFSWAETKEKLEDSIFEWAKDHVSAVSNYLEKETQKMTPGMEESLGKAPFVKSRLLSLPSQGRPASGVLEELSSHASKENLHWKAGKMSGTVYTDDEAHIQFMNQIYGLYSVANVLHPGVWPRLNQCEAELVAMTSDLLHNTDGAGCTTSGGTESIMLAIKAHLVYYGKRRGIVHPELICGSTAHAAVDKACESFGIRKVCIDCNDGSISNSYTLHPSQVERYITSNTIMIYASAPCYPQGTIDPIEELGLVAQDYDIGLHVDACLGGFVLPFCSELFPKFDFSVKGVTSMSTDTHKFGYAPKGTSLVLYRDHALRHAQYFCYAHWTGGMYATPTFAGSRPSALVGCAWASLVSIGKEGYQARTQQILRASSKIAEGIQYGIPELSILGNQRPSMIVCIGSSTSSSSSPDDNDPNPNPNGGVDIYRVADAMKERGWDLNSLQHPASIHVCVTLALAPQAELFLTDLKEAVAQVEKEDPSHSQKGTAGMYGLAGSVPEGPVNDFLRSFLDLSLRA